MLIHKKDLPIGTHGAFDRAQRLGSGFWAWNRRQNVCAQDKIIATREVAAEIFKNVKSATWPFAPRIFVHRRVLPINKLDSSDLYSRVDYSKMLALPSQVISVAEFSAPEIQRGMSVPPIVEPID